jgi:hypothetical protein
MDREPIARVKEKTVIGWSEVVSLPTWGIRRLKAKIDTGARSSALHVENLVFLPGEVVEFDVVLNLSGTSKHRVTAPITRWARVLSSNGTGERRPFVKTKMKLGGVVIPVEMSLVSRGEMRFRMLVGRTALASKFLVDSGKRAPSKPKTKKKRKKTK